ncbi:MAG: sensor domain-containing diguanylate cyclase [Candidatus Omnitrophota bacterium]
MFKKIPPQIFVVFLLFFTLSSLFYFLHYAPQFIWYVFATLFLLFISFYYFALQNRRFCDKTALKKEGLTVEKNLAEGEVLRFIALRDSLFQKVANYQRLENFTQDLNNNSSLEYVVRTVVDEVFHLFNSKGNVLLYLVGEKSRRLELRACAQEDLTLKIKEKTGDFFDEWVLRHAQPLLVDAATSDFRFDPDKVKEGVSRFIGSVMCVPLITQARLIGVLRIDSSLLRCYTSEDLRFLSVVADIAKLALENAIYFKHMQELSITDGLTGLFLRRHALERFKEEFLRAQRDKASLSFLMIDIDHFKDINERFGHLGGDFMLKKMALWLKSFFNSSGFIVCRYGGEEFCVALAGLDNEEAVLLAEDFRKFLATKQAVIRHHKVKLTVSIGVASFPRDSSVCDDLIRFSDDALLKAKRAGRDRVCSL